MVSTRTFGARSAYRSDQRPGRLDAAGPGHLEIHQDDVRGGRRHLLQRLGAVARLADDGQVGLGAEHHRDPGPEHRLVVDQEHRDAHDRLPGIVTSMTHRPDSRRQ